MGKTFYGRLGEKERYIINSCFFAVAVSGLYGIVGGSLLPAISEQYNLSNTVSGALLSAQEFGGIVAGFIGGILPVYLGDKKSVIFFSSFAIIGLTLLMITGKPFFIILAFLLMGSSKGALSNFNNSMVNDISNSSSAALNVLHGIFTLGAILAPFLVIMTSGIGRESGWKVALGVIITLVFISIFFFSKMESDRTIKKGKTNKKSSYAFLKNKHFWISTGILFFYLCTEKTITGWMVKYFIDSSIMPSKYAQMLASLFWVVILAGRLTCAFIGDKLAKSKLLLLTSIGAGSFYVLLLSTTNLYIITISVMGLGFSMGGIYPTTIANAGGIIKDYPMAMGAILVIGGVGSVVMPIIAGALAETYGVLTGMSSVIIAILLMIVFIIMNLTIKSKKSQ